MQRKFAAAGAGPSTDQIKQVKDARNPVEIAKKLKTLLREAEYLLGAALDKNEVRRDIARQAFVDKYDEIKAHLRGVGAFTPAMKVKLFGQGGTVSPEVKQRLKDCNKQYPHIRTQVGIDQGTVM